METTTNPLGREAGLERALGVLKAHGVEGDDITLGGIARGLVGALLDEHGYGEGYDWATAGKFEAAANAAHDEMARQGWLTPVDRSEPFTAGSVNGRMVAGAVLRAAIKAGLVVADSKALSYIAVSGSAGHDDTVASMRADAEGAA